MHQDGFAREIDEVVDCRLAFDVAAVDEQCLEMFELKDGVPIDVIAQTDGEGALGWPVRDETVADIDPSVWLADGGIELRGIAEK